MAKLTDKQEDITGQCDAWFINWGVDSITEIRQKECVRDAIKREYKEGEFVGFKDVSS